MTDPSPNTHSSLPRPFTAPRIPRATYRVQFSPSFDFEEATRWVAYLDTLGISDLYASPLFKPRKGSTHGYDTVDYNTFNPDLGTSEAFDRLSKALSERGMGLLLDIVPNHMGFSTENAWWADTLKNGPSSKYARYFDIDWTPQNRVLDNKILLPVLHNHYGRVLEEGHLKVVYWHGDFYVHYYENQFPMTPESYVHILERTLRAFPDEIQDGDTWVPMEVASLIHSLKFLPPYWLTDADSIETREREQTIIRWRLLGLFDKSNLFRKTLQGSIDAINGAPGDATSYDTLDLILSEQPYYLAYWHVASDEINYRRFFDINDMVAIRTEDQQVFDDVHGLTFSLLAQGKVTGLRIDHPDGLWDPQRYFWRLQSGFVRAALRQQASEHAPAEAGAELEATAEAALAEATSTHRWPLYVLVEKILSESEPLPTSWSIYGTTGYDFMYAVNNLFVDASRKEEIDYAYTAFTGEDTPFDELTDETKKQVMTQSLTSEIAALSALLARIVEKNRRYRGFTQNSLAFGLSECISALDIYRTYITGTDSISDRDRTYIEAAMTRAKENNPLVPGSIFDFLCDILLMRNFDEFKEPVRDELRHFVMKFQQITGPVMAKSMEDTAFYIFNRLVSLNEVGGHPDHFGISVDDFHTHNLEKLESYPYTMLSTSTHDTKRSEDVRCRINVLSEMPERWYQYLRAWTAINAGARDSVNGKPAPTPNDEYLIYQTLLGAYDPLTDEKETFQERIVAYLHKAINEAKTNSNWTNPHKAYASAVTHFISSIWNNEDFIESFMPLLEQIAFFGRLNSLSQLLLKLTSPGVPDLYQGTELWNYSLVDPDNRRPVDFEYRTNLLDALREKEAGNRLQMARELLDTAENGTIKLYLAYRTLNFRRKYESLFREGAYMPIQTGGTNADHICAFARQANDLIAITLAPRLMYGLLQGTPRSPLGEESWLDTHIILPYGAPKDGWRLLHTGEYIDAEDRAGYAVIGLKDALKTWPLAVVTNASLP